MSRHRARDGLLRVRPRYRFVVATSGIVGLVFAVTAAAAALSPHKRHDVPSDVDRTATARPLEGAPTSGAAPTTPTVVTLSAQPTPTPPATSPPEPTSTTPEAAGRVLGAYEVSQEWPDGFIGAVRLSNDSGGAASWRVRLKFPDTVFDLQKHWIAGGPGGATVTRTGQTVIFDSYEPLAAGSIIELDFQFVKKGGNFDPIECWVNGWECS